MSLYVISLSRLHRSLTAVLGDFPLYAANYRHWVDAVANSDDPDELDFRLREDDAGFTTFERDTIVRTVTDFFHKATATLPMDRISYTISVRGSSLMLKYDFDRKDRELIRLRTELSDLRRENMDLTVRLEEYEEI